MAVDELAVEIGQSVANTSQHLHLISADAAISAVAALTAGSGLVVARTRWTTSNSVPGSLNPQAGASPFLADAD